MCTVTIVPKPDWPGAFRMACNRDESHGRAPAEPPASFVKDTEASRRGYLMPTDPSSNGTWVAVNDAGLAFTLLNYNLSQPPKGRDMSRGDVIPSLLQATTMGEVIGLARTIKSERMMPFRLVVCDGRSLMLWPSTEPIEQVEVVPWSGEPVMFTSSGLGDDLVEGPRRALFEDWFGDDPSENFEKQDGFHRHRWPDRQHLSINMHRDDARTVSYTVVDLEPSQAAMHYYADGPDQDQATTTCALKHRLVPR